jgi:hypothetical protein
VKDLVAATARSFPTLRKTPPQLVSIEIYEATLFITPSVRTRVLFATFSASCRSRVSPDWLTIISPAWSPPGRSCLKNLYYFYN